MTAPRDLLDSCDAQVRAQLDPDEDVLATGRCEDITELGSIERGGGGWTYIKVTNQRLRWVPHARLELKASLNLDGVTDAAEQSRGHRYALKLTHLLMKRPHLVPSVNLLIVKWGNAIREGSFTETRLAFSRYDTSAARAIREQLSVREGFQGHRQTLVHHRVFQPDPPTRPRGGSRSWSGSSPGGHAADTLAPRCWEDAARLADALGPAARRDLLRVLTSPSEVRADVIRQLHERPDGRRWPMS